MTRWLTFPDCPNYEVSEQGEIRNARTGTVLSQCTLKRGNYRAVSLWQNNKGRTWPVHVVVAITYHGPRPSPKHEVAHRDGVRSHNAYRNLRWATRAENEADKRLHGTDNSGERNGSSKFGAQDIVQMRALFRQGVARRDIMARFKVEQSHLSRILSRQLWKDVA